MIMKLVPAIDVKTGREVMVKEYTPETDADVEELRRLEDSGRLDARESFADDPAAWK